MAVLNREIDREARFAAAVVVVSVAGYDNGRETLARKLSAS